MKWLKRIIAALIVTLSVAMSIEWFTLIIRSLYETLTTSVVAAVIYGALFLFVLYVTITVEIEGGGDNR
jgi:hypothetical protein